MAKQFHVAGPCEILIGEMDGATTNSLGYSRNGVDLRFEGFFEDVPCDTDGGDRGPPADVNYMGESATVRLELTKWDAALAEMIVPRVNGAVAGVPAGPGVLFKQDGVAFRLIVLPQTPGFDFKCAILRGATEINKGSRYSTLVLEFQCLRHPTSGVLHAVATRG